MVITSKGGTTISANSMVSVTKGAEVFEVRAEDIEEWYWARPSWLMLTLTLSSLPGTIDKIVGIFCVWIWEGSDLGKLGCKFR